MRRASKIWGVKTSDGKAIGLLMERKRLPAPPAGHKPAAVENLSFADLTQFCHGESVPRRRIRLGAERKLAANYGLAIPSGLATR
jgi:hypothetical protein